VDLSAEEKELNDKLATLRATVFRDLVTVEQLKRMLNFFLNRALALSREEKELWVLALDEITEEKTNP
jgi:hypothetical protein